MAQGHQHSSQHVRLGAVLLSQPASASVPTMEVQGTLTMFQSSAQALRYTLPATEELLSANGSMSTQLETREVE